MKTPPPLPRKGGGRKLTPSPLAGEGWGGGLEFQQVPQQMGVLFIITQQVQPSLSMVFRQSQQA